MSGRDVITVYILIQISNGNKTEWSPIRSVIIRVITKSRLAGKSPDAQIEGERLASFLVEMLEKTGT